MKIALIVDNPTRDLDGMVLLARELAKNQHHVLLVPMYSAGYEIPALAPDFVLFNYARHANTPLLHSLHGAGIKIGILDTEGGIWESPEQFIKSVAHAENLGSIDQYFVWGNLQREALLKHTQLKPEIISVTGCPRYDFCVQPWLATIAKPPVPAGYVLIISNFALSYPRFVNPDTEIRNMSAAGYDLDYARARAADEHVSRQRLIEVIRTAAEKLPGQNFVIRTHPFEDDSEYRRLFAEFANVKIVRDGPVSMWLKAAKLTLHINSSVGVDAALMSVPVYSADWISTALAKGMSALPLQVSRRLTSLEEFFAAVENPQTPPQDSDARKNLEDWFFHNDGKSHTRLSEGISSFLKGKSPPDLSKCRRLFFFGSKNPRHLIGRVDSLGRLILGAKNYRWFRNNLLTKNIMRQTKSDKFFTKEQVNTILDKLNEIDSGRYQAFNASEAAAFFPRAVADSILIKR